MPSELPHYFMEGMDEDEAKRRYERSFKGKSKPTSPFGRSDRNTEAKQLKFSGSGSPTPKQPTGNSRFNSGGAASPVAGMSGGSSVAGYPQQHQQQSANQARNMAPAFPRAAAYTRSSNDTVFVPVPGSPPGTSVGGGSPPEKDDNEDHFYNSPSNFQHSQPMESEQYEAGGMGSLSPVAAAAAAAWKFSPTENNNSTSSVSPRRQQKPKPQFSFDTDQGGSNQVGDEEPLTPRFQAGNSPVFSPDTTLFEANLTVELFDEKTRSWMKDCRIRVVRGDPKDHSNPGGLMVLLPGSTQQPIEIPWNRFTFVYEMTKESNYDNCIEQERTMDQEEKELYEGVLRSPVGREASRNSETASMGTAGSFFLPKQALSFHYADYHVHKEMQTGAWGAARDQQQAVATKTARELGNKSFANRSMLSSDTAEGLAEPGYHERRSFGGSFGSPLTSGSGLFYAPSITTDVYVSFRYLYAHTVDPQGKEEQLAIFKCKNVAFKSQFLKVLEFGLLSYYAPIHEDALQRHQKKVEAAFMNTYLAPLDPPVPTDLKKFTSGAMLRVWMNRALSGLVSDGHEHVTSIAGKLESSLHLAHKTPIGMTSPVGSPIGDRLTRGTSNYRLSSLRREQSMRKDRERAAARREAVEEADGSQSEDESNSEDYENEGPVTPYEAPTISAEYPWLPPPNPNMNKHVDDPEKESSQPSRTMDDVQESGSRDASEGSTANNNGDQTSATPNDDGPVLNSDNLVEHQSRVQFSDPSSPTREELIKQMKPSPLDANTLLLQHHPNFVVNMLRRLRTMVSLKKIRWTNDGFNLDLAYITDDIIAMGYPAIGREELYRNPHHEVLRHLEIYHGNGVQPSLSVEGERKYSASQRPPSYKIFNLCSERYYPPTRFGGSFQRFPSDDHMPPPLQLLLDFCASAAEFMSPTLEMEKQKRQEAEVLDEPIPSQPPEVVPPKPRSSLDCFMNPGKPVVAVHCKAGKGRTGVMIVALLLYTKRCATLEDALYTYNSRRTTNCKGVSITSQIRFLRYFSHMLNEIGPTLPRIRPVKLHNLSFSPIPWFDLDGGCTPYVVVRTRRKGHYHIDIGRREGVFTDAMITILDTSAGSGDDNALKSYTGNQTAHIPLRQLEVIDEIQIDIFCRKSNILKQPKDEYMCGFWVHTSFLDGHTGQLRLEKSEIDGASKDLAKYFDDTFCINLEFTPLPPRAREN